ncbi:hypothetical protein BJ684DRAFT_11255 [Piptocephalis cylindrospora]|uniref:SET domain-containing protein n=1 Tax=Piptocephalis cylindrospora TaxID=1907219 RepID=A0A4P9Y1E2_9FUNG|nr:hypothetical protein BJ684DRAFT_11255 [Piptocephalis cylindrospora]|eukprot:RKP12597.1 hypothetical protein BJ684DRAFT_11255 [Piptocephalis cylindrospora]
MTSAWLDENWQSPRLVRECHDGCGCDPEVCLNRGSHKQDREAIEVFLTKDRGWGVQARRRILRGECVGEYVGERLSQRVAEMREYLYDRFGLTYSFGLEATSERAEEEDETEFEWENPTNVTLDGTFVSNHTRFFNHSCDPNIIVVHVSDGDRDHRGIRYSFYTVRDVKKGEELTFDYQLEGAYPDDSGNYECRCGSANCRKTMLNLRNLPKQ